MSLARSTIRIFSNRSFSSRAFPIRDRDIANCLNSFAPAVPFTYFSRERAGTRESDSIALLKEIVVSIGRAVNRNYHRRNPPEVFAGGHRITSRESDVESMAIPAADSHTLVDFPRDYRAFPFSGGGLVRDVTTTYDNPT